MLQFAKLRWSQESPPPFAAGKGVKKARLRAIGARPDERPKAAPSGRTGWGGVPLLLLPPLPLPPALSTPTCGYSDQPGTTQVTTAAAATIIPRPIATPAP